MRRNQLGMIYLLSLFSSLLVLFYIIFPIFNTITWTKGDLLLQTLKDRQAMGSIYLSITAATLTTIISLVLGVPFAYWLARKDFKGKSLVESIINIPVVIPHPVAGICLLTIVSPYCWFGRILASLGIEVAGTVLGIVAAMVFVSIPFLIHTAKDSFANVSPRLEFVARTLGATQSQAFLTVSLPLAKRGIIEGVLMTWARAISEFGAVIVLSYHPMIAPTKIYETFLSYGLTSALPLTTIMIILCLVFLFLARLLTKIKRSPND